MMLLKKYDYFMARRGKIMMMGIDFLIMRSLRHDSVLHLLIVMSYIKCHGDE